MSLIDRFHPWLFVVSTVFTTAVAAQTPSAAVGGPDDPLKHCKVTIIDEISVPAEEMGVLDELNVREGMLVEKDALLGTIDKTDAELALAIARHDYEAAKKAAENEWQIKAYAKMHEVAVAEYEGSMEANGKSPGAVTQSEIRQKRLKVDQVKLQAENSSEELAIARLTAQAKYKAALQKEAAIKRHQIVSRINGVVVKLNKHVGEWVQPGETVLRIVRMDQLRVEGDINGRVYARHEVLGRPVSITVKLTGGGEEKLDGKIVYASPIIESSEYTVRAEIENRKINGRWLLTPGLDAEMKLGGGDGLGFQFSRAGQ